MEIKKSLKENYLTLVSFAFIAVVLFFIFSQYDRLKVSSLLISQLNSIRHWYEQNTIIAILSFCLAHFLSASLSIPGGCTFLNTLSGAVFGFWKGIIIVYVVTIASGMVGYFLGRHFLYRFVKSRFQERIESLEEKLQNSSFVFLVALRLSPLLPYGVINIVLGGLNIRWTLFMASTVVGVFFDVVLLNSLGAVAAGATRLDPSAKWHYLGIFLVLFFLFYCAKIIKTRVEKKSNLTE